LHWPQWHCTDQNKIQDFVPNSFFGLMRNGIQSELRDAGINSCLMIQVRSNPIENGGEIAGLGL
jgi:hypothetical protein